MIELSREQRDMIKTGTAEVQLGKPLPWAIFDAKRRTLLRKGMVIATPAQLALLADQAVYRGDEAPHHTSIEERNAAPFFIIGEMMGRLSAILQAVAGRHPDFSPKRLDDLCIAMQVMCAEDADAALAAVHLDSDGKYAVRHLIHSALLVELVTCRLGYLPDDRQRLIAAALTANVGMLELQERLLKQEDITPEQRQEINRHCEESVALLRKAGVQDEFLLEIVMQHHERIDGAGYPRGLRGGEIHEGARIIALADIYHAKISGRGHRSALLPTQALRQMLLGQGLGLDQELAEVFIKELGVYPPGGFVRLSNGDVAVVTHRGQDGISPRVGSIITPRGTVYPRPVPRDIKNKEWTIKEIVVRDDTFLLTDLLPLWGY